jgi:hypothetical protein
LRGVIKPHAPIVREDTLPAEPPKVVKADLPMRKFGRILRGWREAAANPLESQRRAAEELERHGARESVSTSLVAQLEAGGINTISPEMLRAIESVYGLRQDEAFASYAHYRFGLSEMKSLLLRQEVIDLIGLAHWESGLQRRHESEVAPDYYEELWIVTEKILDDKYPEFQDAIITLLRRGCIVRYVHASPKEFADFCTALEAIFEARFNKKFDEFRERLRETAVDAAELAFMTSSIVISHPRKLVASADAKDTEAFLELSTEIFSERGASPAFGLKITNKDYLRTVVMRLDRIIKEKAAPKLESGTGKEG